MKKEPSRNVNIVCVCLCWRWYLAKCRCRRQWMERKIRRIGFHLYFFIYAPFVSISTVTRDVQQRIYVFYFSSFSTFHYSFYSIFFSSCSFMFTKMETSLLTVVLLSILVIFTSHSHHFFSFHFNYNLALSSSFSCLKRPFFPSFQTFFLI